MTLEKDLQQLQSLGVGSVEAVIGDIERLKLQRQEVEDKRTVERAKYESLVAEKLPRIIGNIITLGQTIYDLGNQKGYLNLKIEKGRIITQVGDSDRLTLDIKRKLDCSVLTLTEDGFWSSRNLRMVLDGQKGVMEEIALNPYTYEGKRFLFFSGKSVSGAKISAKTPEDFTQQYINLLRQHYAEDRFDLVSSMHSIPLMLSQVPELVRKMYEQVLETPASRYQNEKANAKSIENLDVSDFS